MVVGLPNNDFVVSTTAAASFGISFDCNGFDLNSDSACENCGLEHSLRLL